MGSTDLDICLFQFLRFRFYSDLIRFVKPFLRVSPPIWEKYLGDNTYIEPLREEVLAFKKLWRVCMRRGDRWASDAISAEDRALLEVRGTKWLKLMYPFTYFCMFKHVMMRRKWCASIHTSPNQQSHSHVRSKSARQARSGYLKYFLLP